MQYYAMLTFYAIKKGQVDCKVPSLGIVLFQRKSNIHSSQEKFLTWSFDSTNKDEDFLQLVKNRTRQEWSMHLYWNHHPSTLGKDGVTASHWANPNGIQKNYFYYYAHMKFSFPT